MWKGLYTRSFDHLTALHIILEETAFCHVYISPQHSRVSYLGMRRFVHRSVIMKRLCAQKVWLQKGCVHRKCDYKKAVCTESVITKRLVHRKCDYEKAVCTESVITKRLCAQKVWLQKGCVHRKCDYKKAVCTESVITKRLCAQKVSSAVILLVVLLVIP